MRMCDQFRIKGWWFLPQSPEARVPGILTWSQGEGANLEVIGGFTVNTEQSPEAVTTSPDGDLFGGNPGPTAIFGETDTGKPVSLWDAERHRYKGDVFGNAREEVWHGPWACIGAHIASVDTVALHDPVVALDNLYYLTDDGRFCPPVWANIEGVDQPWEWQDDGTYLCPYTLPVAGGVKANVAVGASSQTNYRVETHATGPWISPATEAMPDLKLQFMTKRTRSGPAIQLSVGARVRFEQEENAWSAQGMLDALNPLGALMRLATFADSGVEYLSATTADKQEVSLFCQLGNESDPQAVAEAGGIVFTFADIDLQTYMSTWDRLTEGPQATYAWNIATGMVSHSSKLVEANVSQVLAGAEGFHTWCLGESRDISLQARLTSLHDRLDKEVAAVLGLDVAKWADWAVWARNHVAHGGTKRHREIGDVFRLKIISDTVRLVTYLVALAELPLPAERVVWAIHLSRLV